MNILFAVLLWINVQLSSGFAEWMMTDFCDRGLTVGEVIMNDVVIVSDERSIKVYRNDDQEILSGGEYFPGEKLQVAISNNENQFVIETSAGKIYGGGCHGRRQANKGRVLLTLPSVSEETEVEIVAGWAEGHSQVKMTRPFVLKPNLSGAFPPEKEKTISVSQDKFNRQYRRGYVTDAKVVPDTEKDVPPPKPEAKDFVPRVRGEYNPPVNKRALDGEESTESNLRGKVTSSDHVDSTEGSAPKEGREEAHRISNAAPSVSKAKSDAYPRHRSILKPKINEMSEEEKEAERLKAANFSALNHALTFSEVEFVVITLILLIFVVTMLYQMYTGRYKLPSIFGFMYKRPGGRYSN